MIPVHFIIKSLLVLVTAGSAALAGTGQTTIRVGGDSPRGEMRSFWHVANFAFGGTRTFSSPEDEDFIRQQSPFTREVMVDYALGGRYPEGEEYYFGQGPDGELLVDFSKLIRRIRNARAAGYKPWIGLENVPPLMSDPVQWDVYGNSAPPRDYELFHTYTRMAMEAIVAEFGEEEVARWNFIIATEPDLKPAHWSGTKEEFLLLLDHTLQAALEVAPRISISPGNILNPAFVRAAPVAAEEANLVRARDNWGLDIIDHMAAGDINPQGTPGSKMDFFSYSWYARVGRPLDTFDRAFAVTRERLSAYPQYKDIPVDVREFAILIDENGNRLYAGDASEYGASFYAAIARRVYDHGIRYVFEWDHATQGVLHPRGQVIAMLERMKGGRSLNASVAASGSPAECGAIASRKDQSLFVLVYNHQPDRGPDRVEQVLLQVDDPLFANRETCLVQEWIIDRDHASWIHAFLADAQAAGLDRLPKAGLYEGSPRRLIGGEGPGLFRSNIAKYRRLSVPPQTRENEVLSLAGGGIELLLPVRSHSVRLLKFTPGRPAGAAPSAVARPRRHLNK